MRQKLSKNVKNIFAAGALLLLLAFVYDQFISSQIIDRYAGALDNVRDTVTAAGIIYIFAGIFNYIVNQNVRKLLYKKYLRKVIAGTSVVLGVLAAFFIWIDNQETFLTYFGFMLVAIAISFQDLFKNLMGSLIINTTRNIEVGDSIEVNGHLGKVVDIGFLYTTLLESPSWEDVGQINNKEIKLPNQVFSNQVSKSYDIKDTFIWDEIMFKIPEDKKVASIEKQTNKIVAGEIESQEQPSKQFLQRLSKHVVGGLKDEHNYKVYFDLENSDVVVTIRYLVPSKEVREVRSNIIKKMSGILGK